MTTQFDAYLHKDALSLIYKDKPNEWASLSKASKMTRSVVARQYVEIDRAILDAIPSLIPEMKKTDISSENALLVFKRLINNLHDEAKRLNGKLPNYSGDRLTWETIHYKSLVNDLRLRIAAAKAKDFNKFVRAVAAEAGISMPAHIPPKKFWNDTLKEDMRITQIKKLDLAKKRIKYIPSQIAALTSLQRLNLAHNLLKDLPPEFSRLTALRQIDIGKNRLKKLPPELTDLPSLQSLQLEGNKLTGLPPSLATLSNLEYLDLSMNPFEEVPSQITSLSKLKYLYLSNISLKKFSADFTPLSNLQELHFNNARLEEITHLGIAALSSLQRIHLLRNPLSANALAYLEQIRSQFPLVSIQYTRDLGPRRLWQQNPGNNTITRA